MVKEIGTLRTLPNGESVFVGSSSGVFFINTVRRAFSHAVATASSHVPPEECIVGESPHVSEPDALSADNEGIKELPTLVVAKELMMTYFRTWHPLFPFLHGPSFVEQVEDMYAEDNDYGQTGQPKPSNTGIILQCLFNIAKRDRPDLPHLGRLQIRSDDQMMIALSKLSLKRDLSSIQAMLSIQLYFVATMSLHAASSAGGMLLHSIFKLGLHRCPVRYASFDVEESEMRKRVFWSAYTLERFVSQSLGYPLGIQDSDIDVCPPGEPELHQPTIPLHSHDTREGTLSGDSVLHPGPTQEIITNKRNEATASSGLNDATSQRLRNQTVQAEFVRYSRLLGRVVEMFHKSISTRSIDHQDVLYLKADIDAWRNSFPYAGSSNPATNLGLRSDGLDQDVFFAVAQQQLLLLVNRPSLSQDPTSAEFHHAIQLCIGAARSMIRMIESHFDSRGTLFWPGFMSSVWMSGLVLVFACQLKLHSLENAISDISASLRILEAAMMLRWSIAHNCHQVLSMLLESIQSPPSQTSQDTHEGRSRPQDAISQGQLRPQGTKRARDCLSENPAEHEQSRTPQRQRTLSENNAAYEELFVSTTPEELESASSHGQVEVLEQQPTGNMGMPCNSATFNPSEWDVPLYSDFGFDPTAQYDMFNGAMWGSLLELVEPNG